MDVKIKNFDECEKALENGKQITPIIEPKLLYASEDSFKRESSWIQKLEENADSKTLERAKNFYNNYQNQWYKPVVLNWISSAIDFAKEWFDDTRINKPIYDLLYDKQLLDKGYSVYEIIKLVEIELKDNVDFKNYVIRDVDIWGSLTLSWGESKTNLNYEDEYYYNSRKLKNNQHNHFFSKLDDKQLLEFKEAYEDNESLVEWINNSCFKEEYDDWLKRNKRVINQAALNPNYFVRIRLKIKDISIIQKQLEERNLVSSQQQEIEQ
ncbi:hypothetical protein [Ureaplasma diversum]|uniref:Uncharacterized protein n=1 Tax=Ureaplasma diversum NCTC 246 TaxID=1188241 RepID=A0A084EWA8_9BACT|nr:hypothetical protein [Ureaplasma diversum]KEZ22250.1 hypothetical protein UDIV_6910 [Ureaplasma diversum NCTC 246]